MTFADSQLVYRDLTGPWGTFRLNIGGRDVTEFRGAPAQLGSYQLQEPYGYGPADFSIPAVSSMEPLGVGDLAWAEPGKPAELTQALDGARVRIVWRGFVSTLNPTSGGLNLHCDGAASGKLAKRDKHPDLFPVTKDVGTLIYDAFRVCRTGGLDDYLGPVTGIELSTQGRSGQFLSYVDELLGQAMTASGNQWTVLPAGGTSRKFTMQLKDRTTVHATIFNGAAGVEVDLTRDLAEEPTTIYGAGISPDGYKWVNGRYPGLIQGSTPDYPMAGGASFGLGTTNADTTSGSGIADLNSKLIGMGYMDREDAGPEYDADTVAAVKDLQDDAGLAQTGNMNPATWDALYDLNVTGLSLGQAFVAPLAQDPAVKKWNRTSNGSQAGLNDAFDPARVEVDLTVDHGPGARKTRGSAWSKAYLARVQNGKNWAGTITLVTDVAAGSHTHGTTPSPLSRLDLEAGQNVLLRNFDGDTLLHISGIDVTPGTSPDEPATVRLAVDTKARDLLTLGQILQRNRESRQSPSRQFVREHRGTDANHGIVEWSEVGGRIFTTVNCPGGAWSIFPVIAGQSGTVNRIRIKTTDAESPFVAAVFAKRITPGELRRKVGNPFDTTSPISHVRVTDGGSGYTSAPTVSIDGSATGVASIADGKVVSVALTNRGGGYDSSPSVSFSGGGGSGASAEASIVQTGGSKWTDSAILDDIDARRILLGAWGDVQQPGGYHPLKHTNENGVTTSAPVTGVMLEDAGFSYHTFDKPVLYVAIYPRWDCKIRPQRIMWPDIQAGV